jgi:GDSL-like Lipase/Acylhydrolase family
VIRSSLSSFVRAVAVVAVVTGLAATFACAGSAAGTTYAALGDSYSSGVGTNSYTLDSACKRSVYAYPYLWAQKHAGTALSFVACSGATTSNLLSTQIQAVTSATTLVTMTIGGNDIGFANLIYRCTLTDCTAALDATTASLGTTLNGPLDQVFNAVKSRAAFDAKIIVVGYPQVFSSVGCFGTLGITSTERAKANALAVALDTLISKRALADGVTYTSALQAFTGHAVCSSSPWLNGLNLLSTTESYHPNRSGHSAGYLKLVTSVTG